jgi:hypothetical protein
MNQRRKEEQRRKEVGRLVHMMLRKKGLLQRVEQIRLQRAEQIRLQREEQIRLQREEQKRRMDLLQRVEPMLRKMALLQRGEQKIRNCNCNTFDIGKVKWLLFIKFNCDKGS